MKQRRRIYILSFLLVIIFIAIGYSTLGTSLSFIGTVHVKGSHAVTFNANGGSVSTSSKRVVTNDTYGDLPTPTKIEYEFLGWYTDATGGEKVESSTIVSSTTNHTLYARWTRPTAPEITGGSGEWVGSSKTISIKTAGFDLSGIKNYEYYKSKSSTAPSDTTIATGTTSGDVTINETGIIYIWYRTISNHGYRSTWSNSQTLKMDLVDPTAEIKATNHCSSQTTVLNATSTNDKLRFNLSGTSNNISGTTIYYCKDTTNSCNPTNTYSQNILSFATGTYYIRYKIVSGAGRSSSVYSYKAIVNDTRHCAINMIYNGSFEYGTKGWYGVNFEIVEGASHGSKALRFNHDNGNDFVSMTQQTMPTPILNHKYYGSLKFKSSSSFSFGSVADSRFEFFHNDKGHGHMEFAAKSIQSPSWQKLSSIQSITTSNEYLNDKWIIRNFIRGAKEYSYADEVLVVDLSAIYGVGSEPTIEWADKYINFDNLLNETESFEIVY